MNASVEMYIHKDTFEVICMEQAYTWNLLYM